MKQNRYELTGKRIQEEIYLEYTDGHLSAIVMPIKYRLNEIQFRALMDNLPMAEENLEILEKLKLTVTKELPGNVKIAMFCEKYMEYHGGQKYKATVAEGKIIKNFKISYELLDHYFTTTNFLFFNKHSIFNLTRYWNELQVDYGNKGKKGHPNYYSKEYADKLKLEDASSYWKHLRDLGLEPKKNSVGYITDWIKKVN